MSSIGDGSNLLDRDGLCLLSLDGGGVRGLSSLYLLKAVMDRLNHARGTSGLPAVKPCEVFDLVGGTSTGGLISIMLGRLEMDVDECILDCSRLISTIFEKKQHFIPTSLSGQIQPRFDSEKLKAAIEEVIIKRGLSPTDPFNDGVRRGCRVFVCAATKELYGIERLRSYSLPDELDLPATICDAALATSAATVFFNPVSIGARHFMDAALGKNNPVDEVEGEASNIWCNDTGDLKPLVKCFISIGTGNPGKKAVEDGLLKFLTKTLRQIATETEETAGSFMARWRQHYDLNRYFRFNVEQGLQDVGLADQEQGTIETATYSYLKHQAQKFRIRDCVQNLQQKQRMADINLQSKVQNYDPKHIKFLRQLSTLQYGEHKDRNPERVLGTCEWFINHPLFRGWQERSSGLLWVSADPGCGKSVLARYLIDAVLPPTDTRATCYFFFKDDFQDQKSLQLALRCILRQLFRQRPGLLSDKILNQFEEDGEDLFTSFRNLWDIFVSVTNSHNTGEIICVLDALDECEEKGRSQLIVSLNKLYSSEPRKSTLKFLLTSRPYLHIRRDFKPLTSHQPTIHSRGETQEEVEKISAEIDIVIRRRVGELSARLELRPEERGFFQDELTAVGNRTYLWVHLVFDVIQNCITLEKGDLRANIRSLPKSVEAAYDKILSSSCDAEKAKKLLHIVVAAERPLSLQEMATAMTIKEHHRSCRDVEIEPEDRFREAVKAICGLFVVIIDSKIYLLHQTAKEFLVRPPSTRDDSTILQWKHSLFPAKSHGILSEICIWYLLFTDFAAPGRGDRSPFFLDYSANNWATHVRRSDTTSSAGTTSLVLRLCEDTERCRVWFQKYWTTIESVDPCPQGFTPLLVASYFGLEQAVNQLLEKGMDYRSKDTTYGRSALSWASANGHGSVVELILNMVSKLKVFFKLSTIVNSKDGPGRTPLWYAAANGHGTIVKSLLRKGAKVASKDSHGGTPLAWAARNGHETVFKLLLDQGANIESRDNYGQTPLFWAARSGYEAVVKLLLDQGANIDLKDNDGQTPLLWAASSEYEAVVKLLQPH